MSQPVLKAEHLSKRYRLGTQESYLALRDALARSLNPRRWFGKKDEGQFLALNDVSFSLEQGDVVGVIGHNGAGKSTLLKILSRITPPSSGKVTLNGRVASLLEVGTGFHPELTGRENIYLNGAILGMTKQEIRRKFDAIVDFAETERFLDTPVKHYSSGMYVRLAFAVAAHLDPEILLVDEVLAVGDINFQKKCLGKMSEVTKQEGRTILFVSHNMSAIQTLCPKSLLMEAGQLKMFDTTAKVVEKYVDISTGLVSQALVERTDRTGNGKVKLVDFYLENDQGQRLPYVASGETVTLCFAYKNYTGQPLSKVDFSFTIRTRQETFLVLHKTSYQMQNVELKADHGVLRCTIKDFSLASGHYVVGTEFMVNYQRADEVIMAAPLEVMLGDFFKNGLNYQENHSPVLIHGEWTQQ